MIIFISTFPQGFYFKKHSKSPFTNSKSVNTDKRKIYRWIKFSEFYDPKKLNFLFLSGGGAQARTWSSKYTIAIATRESFLKRRTTKCIKKIFVLS